MMQSDLVSVIIPAYNASLYIEQCVDSVLNQTYKNLEIIVIDDGSTDSTLYVLENFKDERLLIISQENNGCSAAKNEGLRRASGSYIQYLDADDILSKDKIDNQVRALRDKSNSIAVCRTIIFDHDLELCNGEINTTLIQKEGSGVEFLLRLLGSEGDLGMVQPNAYLLPKVIADSIGYWNEDISPSPDEDGEYFARALIQAREICFTEGTNFYRKVSKNSSLSQFYSHQRVCNLIKSIEIKFNHLQFFEDSIMINLLLQKNISQVVYQFGTKYPEIVSMSMMILEKNGITEFKLSGGGRFNCISQWIGFRNTLKVRSFISKYTSII